MYSLPSSSQVCKVLHHLHKFAKFYMTKAMLAAFGEKPQLSSSHEIMWEKFLSASDWLFSAGQTMSGGRTSPHTEQVGDY